MDIKLKEVKGLTLIELIIALLISGILIAALYRTFIGQQKTYTVQEQVVDMQQNVRVSINKMMSEIRMAGFGNVMYVLSMPGMPVGVNGFTQVITPGANTITIVGGLKQIRRDNGNPITIDSASDNTITLDYTPKEDEFNTEAKRYISIGGVESFKFQINGKILTLDSALKLNHPKGTPIFKIQAITYDLGISDGKNVLRRNENTGGNPQPLAENIENVQFEYIDANGNPTADPLNIWMVRVTVTARTDMSDPEYKGGVGGFRRRIIASNIYIRNRGVYF
jgi:prepilin-type N-terminal cleavage/methylation domain-containing protein